MENPPTCIGGYWEEMKACDMCGNERRGKLLKTYNDDWANMAYRFNNEEANPYMNNSNECEIDRLGIYGDGGAGGRFICA